MTTYSYCEKNAVCVETKKVDVAGLVKDVAGILALFAVGTATVVLKTLAYVNF